MFYKKQSEFDLNSIQKSHNLVKGGAVEEEVADMQEVRGWNTCKAGEL